MAKTVLTGNRYLKGQSYPTIDSEIVIEIKQGSTWDEEFFVKGDFTDWNIGFFVATGYGKDRMAIGTSTDVSFGDFTIPVLDDNGDPVLDDNGDPINEELEGFTYFRLIIDSDVTSEMEVSPIAFKQIESPRAGKDYWQADLEASKTIGGELVVEPLSFDLVPVVVRGQV